MPLPTTWREQRDVTRSHQRGSAWHLVPLIGTILVGMLSAPPGSAESIQEDEIVVRGVAFSVPDVLVDQKRVIARTSGFSLLAGLGILWAGDDNVYHSPSDLEQRDHFWGNWLFVRADKRFRKADQLLSTLTWETARYRDSDNANFRRFHFSNWYVRRFSGRTSLELDLDLTRRHYEAVKITGVSYKRDYAYWRYAGKARFVWRLGSGHRVKIGFEGVGKNYNETPGMESLDWRAGIVQLRYRYRFGAYHYLRLRYSIGKRQYEVEQAGLPDGSEPPENPPEEHLYREAIVWYSLPIGSKMELGASYSYRSKDDVFADYESHVSNGVAAYCRLKPVQRAEIFLEGSHVTRSYSSMLEESGGKLRYTRTKLHLGGGYRVVKSVWFLGNVGYYNRDTNNDEGLSYRGYRNLVTALGVSLYL